MMRTKLMERNRRADDMKYDQLLLQDIVIFYEVDLTEDRIVHVKKGVESIAQADTTPFSKIIAFVTNTYILPKCRIKFAKTLHTDYLIEQYMEGNRDFRMQFASKELSTDYRWYTEIIQLVKNPANHHIMAMLSVRDIHEQKLRELAIENAARRDVLTSLYNRAFLKTSVEKFLHKADPESHTAALIILDLDNFKQANDIYGHIYGDQLLCKTARILSRIFPRDTVSRLGGDEFIIFIRRLSSIHLLRSRMQRLGTTICDMLRDKDQLFQISASIGAAIYPQHGTTYEELYAHADEAQYQAKRTGKNNHCIYGEYEPVSAPTNFIGPEWLLDEISDAIYVCDVQTDELLYVNRTMADWYDLNPRDIKGRFCYELLFHAKTPCRFCPRRHIHDTEVYTREKDVLIHVHPHHMLLKTKLVQWNGRAAQLEVLIDLSRTIRHKE